jgi:hypothetical protein
MLRRVAFNGRLLVTTDVPSPQIIVNLIMEALSFSETSVLKRATRHNITEDDILHPTVRPCRVAAVENAL